jgi:hypothetical protein
MLICGTSASIAHPDRHARAGGQRHSRDWNTTQDKTRKNTRGVDKQLGSSGCAQLTVQADRKQRHQRAKNGQPPHVVKIIAAVIARATLPDATALVTVSVDRVQPKRLQHETPTVRCDLLAKVAHAGEHRVCGGLDAVRADLRDQQRRPTSKTRVHKHAPVKRKAVSGFVAQHQDEKRLLRWLTEGNSSCTPCP